MSDDQILRPGDTWDQHYRGSKYHFNEQRRMWWNAPYSQGRVYATNGHDELVELLLGIKPSGGSFRITESGAVITKLTEAEDGEAVYVCEYEEALEFEHVDVLGTGIRPLDLWPSFYDGARYSYKRGSLWWKNPIEDVWQRTVEQLPQHLEEAFNRLKPTGGSLRITENAKVLTLITPQPMPSHLESQYESFSNVQKRLVEVKITSTQRLPVYLGDYHDGFTLRPEERLSDPMTPDEEASVVAFLKQYGNLVADSADPPFDPDADVEDLIEKGQ